LNFSTFVANYKFRNICTSYGVKISIETAKLPTPAAIDPD